MKTKRLHMHVEFEGDSGFGSTVTVRIRDTATGRRYNTVDYLSREAVGERFGDLCAARIASAIAYAVERVDEQQGQGCGNSNCIVCSKAEPAVDSFRRMHPIFGIPIMGMPEPQPRMFSRTPQDSLPGENIADWLARCNKTTGAKVSVTTDTMQRTVFDVSLPDPTKSNKAFGRIANELRRSYGVQMTIEHKPAGIVRIEVCGEATAKPRLNQTIKHVVDVITAHAG